MGTTVSPVREQLRAEMLATLANSRDPMTTGAIYEHCPSAVDAAEVARLAYEMKKKGLIADGGKVLHALGMKVNSYIIADPSAASRIAAAKPIKVERKIPRTIKPPKPAQDHPFKARIVAQEAHDGLTRTTRPLPMHLTTSPPQMAAEGIHQHLLETAMSEDPLQYVPDPDAFSLEPKEPEAHDDIDSDLVDALLELAHLEPKDQAVDDVLAMASADVGEIAAAMGKEWTGTEFHLTEDLAPKKVCQCLRINALPPLPKGYIYGGIRVWIEAEHDIGRMTIATHDGGGGVFCSLKGSGRLSFDPGDLVAIGQVSDALIKLHEAMGKEWTGTEFHLTEDLAPKKVCQCLRINALPPLPKGYIYGGIKVWIEAEHDIGRMTIATHAPGPYEGGGVFCSLKGSGRLSFDPGDLVAIGQVSDALIQLHEAMGDEHE